MPELFGKIKSNVFCFCCLDLLIFETIYHILRVRVLLKINKLSYIESIVVVSIIDGVAPILVFKIRFIASYQSISAAFRPVKS